MLRQIWRALEQAPVDVKHPFRTPVLGTGSGNACGLRTVVLRKAEYARRTLICYSDYRAPKIRQLQQNSEVRWLFYRSDELVQIIAGGSASIHHVDQVAREAWETTPSEHRMNYASPCAPGSEIEEPSSAVLENQPASNRDVFEDAFSNFAVIVTSVQSLDFLKLDAPGHLRARFVWNGSVVKSCWLSP
ncbi:MAG: pyridoxamine-phosphate oxidase [Verrucomicrobia bacterium]|nr:pyridoxamine-phosphate oxidase [Verrucomicrobiota bacterium]